MNVLKDEERDAEVWEEATSRERYNRIYSDVRGYTRFSIMYMNHGLIRNFSMLYRYTWVLVYHALRQTEYEMAKKDIDTVKDNSPKGMFVNVQLTDEEIDTSIQVYQEWEVLFDALEMAARDGYKFGLAYDGESDAFCASFFGKDAIKENNGKILSAWDSDYWDSVRMLVYKHFTKLEGNWANAPAKAIRRG